MAVSFQYQPSPLFSFKSSGDRSEKVELFCVSHSWLIIISFIIFTFIFNPILGDHSFTTNYLQKCQSKEYELNELPTASIVIVSHNEKWSLLVKTIYSIINRSSDNLIEVLIIDDASTSNSFKYHLKSFLIDNLKDDRVKLIRSTSRIGLIGGRNYGASIAIGQVVVFLDSHIEVGYRWLEPLLERLSTDYKRVVSPIVDLINLEDLSYHPVPNNYKVGFTWRLTHFMIPLTKKETEEHNIDPSRPIRPIHFAIRSPTTYGGIFAMYRSFFLELGGHDSEMKYFSFESIDLSLWIWSCGGNIEIVPCSRVGNVFFPSTISVPMKKKNMYLRNSGRVVEIWLKKFRMFHYLLFPLTASVDRGDLSTRKSLQSKLKCTNISWYFENVYPSTPFPFNYRSIGQIEHTPSMLCFDLQSINDGKDKLAHLRPCRLYRGNDLVYFFQIFIYSEIGAIRNDNWCLTGHQESEKISYTVCNSDENSQTWIYSRTNRSLNHKISDRCIHLPTNSNQPILSQCNNSLLEQKFFLRDNLDWDDGNRIK